MMIEALFKQMGFSPAELKKQVNDAVNNFNAIINHFNKRMDERDNNLELIYTMTKEIHDKLFNEEENKNGKE